MIKVILKGDREITGNWDKWDIYKSVLPAGNAVAIVAVSLSLGGEDGNAHFSWSEVVGWYDIKDDVEEKGSLAVSKETKLTPKVKTTEPEVAVAK